MLLGELTRGDRQKIMTICTIDVHSRDVVNKFIHSKLETVSAFQWQSQLRHRWDDTEGDCFANICDAQFSYSHEYLGNTPRLVITPLTDRCYITLTQSLHLVMGGGPAGPAGTGKTETTKDLGRALGIMVYVFNCSEQMDYKVIINDLNLKLFLQIKFTSSLAEIFTRAWPKPAHGDASMSLIASLSKCCLWSPFK